MTGRQQLLFFCLVAWMARVPFVFSTVLQNADETWALGAASIEGATAFREAPSWADRWTQLERTSAGGRILWIFNFYMLGNLCPGPVAAYALNLVFSIVTLILLCATARRMFGERALLPCAILGSFSPYLLHYGFRVVGTMPSVMWITGALYCLCGSPARVRTWIMAGACFGLAFGTHYGVGAVILGLGAGLTLSLKGPEPGRRLAGAVAGTLAALVPLAGLELWARHAGSSYVRRLFSHERLGEDVAGSLSGPHGLFVRHFLELDPLLVGLGLALAVAVAGPSRRRHLGFAALLVAILFVPISRYPPAGSWIIGLALTGLAAVGLRSRIGPVPEGAEGGLVNDDQALTWRGLLVALAATFSLFVMFRPLAAMCRLSFTMWPLFVLAVTGVLARRGEPDPALLRRLVRGGLFILVLAIQSLQRSKGFDREAELFGERNPTWKRLHYINFVRRDLEDGLEILERDRPVTVVTFGPPRLVTPVTFLDEEPFKLLDLQQRLPALDIPRPLTTDEVVYGWIYYLPR